MYEKVIQMCMACMERCSRWAIAIHCNAIGAGSPVMNLNIGPSTDPIESRGQLGLRWSLVPFHGSFEVLAHTIETWWMHWTRSSRYTFPLSHLKDVCTSNTFNKRKVDSVWKSRLTWPDLHSLTPRILILSIQLHKTSVRSHKGNANSPSGWFWHFERAGSVTC